MKSCLIVTFYNGNRDGLQNKDYESYLNIHSKLYDKVSNNISKIYFVISIDNLIKDYFEESKENNKITFYYRNNKNLSFGGWVDVMNLTNYDYYFLCEDDYYFIKDDFDTILINEYNKYNTDYHVLWRTCEMCNENINYNGKFKGEGICTVGIISKNKSLILKDYNKINYNKSASMYLFLEKFNTISYNRNVIFPYYASLNDSIQLYIDDDLSINSKRNPLTFNNVINKIIENKNDDTNPILCCYQYLKLYKPDLI